MGTRTWFLTYPNARASHALTLGLAHTRGIFPDTEKHLRVVRWLLWPLRRVREDASGCLKRQKPLTSTWPFFDHSFPILDFGFRPGV